MKKLCLVALFALAACKSSSSTTVQPPGNEPAPPAASDPTPPPPSDTTPPPAAGSTPTPSTPSTPNANPPGPKPTPAQPTDTIPDSPAPAQAGAGPRMGENCGANDACAPGFECVKYYGIAGARGPQFASCEVRCGGKAKAACPSGTRCLTIADGPGQVCRP